MKSIIAQIQAMATCILNLFIGVIMSNRKTLLSIYGNKYQPMVSASISDTRLCFYCGDIAQCKDHQPPICHADRINSSDGEVEYLLIPSCNECNQLLGSSFTNTADERSSLAKSLLRQKYKSLLIASTIESDRSGLTGRLKRQCMAYDAKAKVIRDRLSFDSYPYENRMIKKDLYREIIEVDGIAFDNIVDAVSFLCNKESISYTKLKKEVQIKGHNPFHIVAQYKLIEWRKESKKIVRKHKDDWFKMPLKLIDNEIDKIKSPIDESALTAMIDDLYDKYLLSMGLER